MRSIGRTDDNGVNLLQLKTEAASASNTDRLLTIDLHHQERPLMLKSLTSPDAPQSLKPTFRQIPDGVLALGNPYATHLYGIMLQIGKRNRSITASWDTLATASNLNRKTVRKTIALLIEHGFVTTAHRYIGGRKASDSITLHDAPMVHIEDRIVPKKDYQWSATGTIDSPPDAPLNGYVTDTNRYVIGDTPTETTVPQPKPTEEPMPRKKEAGTAIPDDFALTDERRKIAADIGIDYDVEWQFQSFVARNEATGTKYQRWDAAWRQWCLKALTYTRPPRPAAPKVDDKVAAAIAERERLLLGQWQGQREALMYAPKSDGPGNVARRIAELDRIITGQVAA